MLQIVPVAGARTHPCAKKACRTGGDSKNAMNVTVDTALNDARPAPPTRDDDAITMALHAAENEGWNPRPTMDTPILHMARAAAHRAGIRRSLGSD